jgi:hypothetical protein
MATDCPTRIPSRESLREQALELAERAASASTYAERRELEQAAVRAWQAAREAKKAVRR